MMAKMLTQAPLPWLPGDAVEIAPSVGIQADGDGGGVAWVHGLAAFAWDGGDEAARRLAAVQLVRLGAAAGRGGVRDRSGDGVAVGPGAARAGGGRAGPGAQGAEGAVEAEPGAGGADRGAGRSRPAAGRDRRRVRGVRVHRAQRVGRVPARGAGSPTAAGPAAPPGQAATEEPAAPEPEPEAYPLAGLLLALPALERAGLLACAKATYGRLRNGFYGLGVMLVFLVFLALLREPRAEGGVGLGPVTAGRRARRPAPPPLRAGTAAVRTAPPILLRLRPWTARPDAAALKAARAAWERGQPAGA